MAGDVNSNIFINVDTSSAMAQLRALEKELTALNRALVVGTKTAAQAQSKYAQGLLHNVNATGQWTASMTRMKTATEQFSTALDRSKLSLKDYFKYGVASSKTFGRVFGNEFDTVSKLVEKRVKILQQQYVQLGRDAQGAMNALKFTPKALNYRDVTTQLMLATQRQQIFNKLLDDGATKLLNFGKNTQWAGRQLMVGFTIPLMLFGTQAIRTFKEIETQIIRFKKVYGDIYTDPGQTEQALKNIRALADEYTKYGVKVSETIKMAADAAAAGNSGKDLEQIVEQTNRLAVLGGVTQEKALETTIALKNAFQIGAKDLDQTINFLNAVENQTVVALEDLTEAIPRVAPVVQQLGGDVKDLAFFMAAMQEGGISAAQGANALKSGLGSLINPSKKAAQAAADVGVNIKGIVEANQGNLRNIVVGFAQALQPLTDLQRTRVIEDVFGKYQFARISALLNNVTKEGTQAARVLQLANASVEELAILSERELGVQADSAMNKFAGAIERLKAAIAPVGEIFAKTLTPAIEFITKMAERFNKLPDGIKKGIAVITAVVGGLGPIFLMTFGLLANALANTMKGFNLLRKGYQSLAYGSSDAALKTQYLTNEELENISTTNALYTSHERLSAAYKIEATSLGALIAQYQSGTNAMRAFSASNPGLFMPGRGVPPIRRAGGGTVRGPGTSTSDSIPAYLSDGEYVINAKAVDQYGVETFDALNARKYASGGPVIGKDGVPRLFTGGWMTRILNSMLPRTRMGVVQEGTNGFALSGFTGGSRAAARVPVVPKSGSSPLVFTEDASGRFKVSLRDDPSSFFYVKSKDVGSFRKSVDDHIAERTKAGDSDIKVYNNFKKQMTRSRDSLGGKSIIGTEQNPSKYLYGLTGYKKSASASKGAPAQVKDAFEKEALILDPSNRKVYAPTRAGNLYQELDDEKAFIQNWIKVNRDSLDEKQVRSISRYNTVAVSHLNPSDRHLWTPRTVARDSALINQALNYEAKRFGSGGHILNERDARAFLAHLETQYQAKGNRLPGTQLAALQLLKRRLTPDNNGNTFYQRHGIKDTQLNLQYQPMRQDPVTKKFYAVDEFAMGGPVRKYAVGTSFVGMPKSFAKVQKARALGQQLDAGVRASRFKNLPITDTGIKLKSLGGYSVGDISRSVNGVYRHPNGRLVVYKAVESEEAALAEMRMSALMRDGSKLNTPGNQSIKVIADPTDLTRQRKILAIESDYDPRFENPKGEFNEKQFIRQTLASGIRGDKDVKRSNLSGSDVIDQGNSGVFSTASGRFKYADRMKSVEEQLLINFGAIKGGASKDFVKAVRDMAKTMGYPSFRKAMLKEIEESIPRYRATIDTFKLTPKERKIYDDLVLRLEESKNADWKKIYNAAAGIPGYADGVFSVPGPKGAGDVVPAMLSPGESVIPTRQTEKYQPLIRSIIADNVPGFIKGSDGIDDPWSDNRSVTNVRPSRADAIADRLAGRIAEKIERGKERGGILGRLSTRAERAIVSAVNDEPRRTTRPVPPSVANPFGPIEKAVKENTKAVKEASNASKNNTRGLLQRLGFDKKNLTDEQKLLRTQGFRGALGGYQKVPDFEERTTKSGRTAYSRASAEQKTNARQLMRMNRTQALMGPSMALGMAGSMAMMYGMSKPESFLGQNMNAIMGVTVLAGLLPLLNSPLKMLIAGVIGLTAVFKMQSAQIKQSILDGREEGKTMVATTEELEEFGKLTNTVSRTQVAEERRAARVTTITPVSMDFGQNLIRNSDFGKKFKADFDKSIATLGVGAGAEALSNKLATAVSQGVLNAAQAESLAIALTRDLKDAKLEMDVRARLIQLIGPDGRNILNDPVQVQIDLIASNRKIQQAAFQNFQNIVARERSGIAGIGGSEAGKLALGAIPAAGAGIYATGAVAQTSALKYANKGYDAAKAAKQGKLAKDFAQLSGQARNAGKIGMAANAVRAIRTGAMATGVVPIAGWISAAIGTVVFGGIEVALRKWQVGQEKKAIAKAAGLFSGITSEALKSTQQGIDALNYEVDFAIKNLELKKKLAKTAAERAQIEQRINDLESKRNAGIIDIQKTQADMLKNVGEQYGQVKKRTFGETIILGGTERGAVRDKFMESYSKGLEQKFKGNASALAALSGLDAQIGERYGRGESDVLTLQIQTLIDSDVLTPQQAGLVLANLSDDTKKAEKELQTIVNVHGTEGLQRLASIQEFIPSAKNRKDLQVFVKTNNKQDAGEVMTAIEELVKLPSYLGFNINIETQKQDRERLESVGKEIEDLKKMVPNGQISLKVLQDLQQKVGGPGKNLTLDSAITQWETLSKLPKELQFNAMITLGSIQQSDTFDKILDRELETAFKKANPTFAMPTNQMPSMLSTQYAAAFAKFKADQKNIDAATKAYFARVMPELYGTQVPSTIKPPGKDTTNDSGKGPDTSWLSELLQRLKLLKEASIDATGSMKELLGQVTKYFGPGLMQSVNPSLDKTKGALGEIEEAARKAGFAVSTEFMELIEGLDAEGFEEFAKQFLVMKEGRVVGFKGTPGSKLSDAEYDRKQKAIAAGTYNGAQDSLFGQVSEAMRTRTIADFIKKQKDSIIETNLQVEAFRKLTDATGEFKFDAMSAMEVLKDPALAKEIALGKKIFSKEEREAIIVSINKTYAAASALSKIKMIQDTEGLQNQVKAFDKLAAAGYDYATILKVIENEAYAYEIANDKVNGLSKETKELVKETENYINALTTLENTKFFQERTNALNLQKDFAAIAPLLAKAGVSLSDINEILSNPTLAKAFIQELKDGQLNAGKIQEYLNQIPKFKEFELKIKLSTREGQEAQFEEYFSKAMEYFDILQDEVEDRFEPLFKDARKDIENAQEAIEGINKTIDDYQEKISLKQREIEETITRPIDLLQQESNRLSNDLLLMDKTADEINKKYDEQEKALNKVFEINQRIAQQQKEQLDLAGALSSGDISAAAQAAQQIRATYSEGMQQDQLSLLTVAREREVGAIRSKSGQTRAQIEQRQFVIGQQIYSLEQKREGELRKIRDIEDIIYGIRIKQLKAAQDDLDKANEALKVLQKKYDDAIAAIDAQRELWTDAKLAIGMASIETGKYNDVISLTNQLTGLLKGTWTEIANGILAAVSALALYNATLKNGSTAAVVVSNGNDGDGNDGDVTIDPATQAALNAALAEAAVAEAAAEAANTAAEAAEAAAEAAQIDYENAVTSLETDLAEYNALTVQRDSLLDQASTLLAIAEKQGAFKNTPSQSSSPKIIPTPKTTTPPTVRGNPVVKKSTGSNTVPTSSMPFGGKPITTKKKYAGGLIKRFAFGGSVIGTDVVPAMLTPGEFVMSRYAVDKYGVDNMKSINSGNVTGDSVYNYSINVNVKSDANPDEIARAVMTQIKQVDSKKLRGASL